MCTIVAQPLLVGAVLSRGYMHRFSRPRSCPSFLDKKIRHVKQHVGRRV